MPATPPPSGAYMVRFERYSPYFTRSADFGLTLRPMDFYWLVYPFSVEDLTDLAYFFQDMNLSEYLVNAATWVEPLNKEITLWRQGWGGPAAPGTFAQRRPVDRP
ncbi:hypothetical protein ACFYO1_02725 [Nocardia sp. NPDC006044]|uniref:hypothetical protein n=1 Tax=Nocardia sp. NPDC006044 TaxID=3364306 RepID=UPI0036905686